jgi:hypothetical protein
MDGYELNGEQISFPNSLAKENNHVKRQTENQRANYILEILHLKQKVIYYTRISKNFGKQNLSVKCILTEFTVCLRTTP